MNLRQFVKDVCIEMSQFIYEPRERTLQKHQQKLLHRSSPFRLTREFFLSRCSRRCVDVCETERNFVYNVH